MFDNEFSVDDVFDLEEGMSLPDYDPFEEEV